MFEMATKVPVLQSKMIFGLRTDISANAHFLNDEEAVYPVGHVIAVHNFNQNRQKIIRLHDKEQVNMLVVSPNRKFIAVCEKGDKPSITIFEGSTLKKKKTIGIPVVGTEVPLAKEFISVQFTTDNKCIMAVTGEPDWMVYCYSWEKGKIECYTKGLNPNGSGTVVQLACNPSDPATILIVGNQLFRLFAISESIFRQWGFSKADLWNLSSCCWLSQEQCLGGTVDGMIHFIENGEFKASFRAAETIVYNFKLGESQPEPDVPQRSETLSDINQNVPIEHLIATTRGFVYTCQHGRVHFFERISPAKYLRRNIFKVPVVTFQHHNPKEFAHMNKVKYVAVNVSEDRIIVTTARTQLYTVRLWGPDITQQPDTWLNPIGPALHHGSISSMALCAWKPIVITIGSLDRTLRVWNYDEDTLLFVKEYQEDLHGVALHPSGLYTTIGFSDKLRYMLVRIDDIEPQKEFPIRSCKQCQFASHGHMFAAVNGNIIQIYSTVSFEIMYNLKGHNGKIVSLSWSAYDLKISSCGLEGAIYEWDLTDPSEVKRSSEYITKNISYVDCAITSDGKSTYAIGVDGTLKLVANSICTKEVIVSPGPLKSLSKSRSDQMLFVAGPLGTIFSIQVPFADTLVYNECKIHSDEVSRIRLTYDDKCLISIGMNGTIIFWKLLFIEGKTIKLNKEFNLSSEILIAHDDLEEKLRTIKELVTRLHEMQTEHSYQFRTMETTHSDKLAEVHANYLKIITELKDRTEHLETDHVIEMNNINADIGRMKAGHDQAMQEQELTFNEKLIVEYDKYADLELQLANLRKAYDKKLTELRESKDVQIQDLIAKYDTNLYDKDVQLEEMHEEIKQLVREHELIKRQIEDDGDREIVELRTKHETQLRDEQEQNIKLRSETMIIKKKYIASSKEIEELKNTVRSLQDDHLKFQQIISKLESDIEDLKKEISERDQTIQDKEKRIHELKRKNQELEKFRFVLNYKIQDLKSQIEPKECLISEQKVQIDDMIEELEQLQKTISGFTVQTADLREKLQSIHRENQIEKQKHLQCKSFLKRMQTDLHYLTGLIQEPNKLKTALKEMYHRYNDGKEFQTSQVEDAEARNEFLRQREHLERTVRGLKKTIETRESGQRDDKMNVVEQSSLLIAETNAMRNKYKEVSQKNSKMEVLLGLKSRNMHPKEAIERLNAALRTKSEIVEMYKNKIEMLEKSLETIKEENLRLVGKVMQAVTNEISS